MRNTLLSLLTFFIACGNISENGTPSVHQVKKTEFPATIGDIVLPAGFSRVPAGDSSFINWLRRLPLKKDKTVYLYNGSLKPNQSAQFAVIDMPRSTKDLMQCADVVMKLRAEYLFSVKDFNAISFTDYAGKEYKWTGGMDKTKFENYLDNVFGWCGSASLEKQLKPVKDINQFQSGDVFVKGGFPGHAMMVADAAVNDKGEKIFLLLQGYQPAQDMHVVVNPVNSELSPWYKIPANDEIRTPEWVFYKNQLRRW